MPLQLAPAPSTMTTPSTYKGSWRAKYRGQWYRVKNVIAPPKQGDKITNDYVLDGVAKPIPQNLLEDLDMVAASFKTRVTAAYTLVTAEALDKQFTKLVESIIELDYAPAEQQKLLNIVKEAYKDLAKDSRTTAIAVTADLNWDAVIKENMAAKEARKQQRLQENKSVLEQYHLERRHADESPKEPVKRKVAQEVEKMGNIVKFDFAHPKQTAPSHLKKEDQDFGDRMTRIKNSLVKINTLMAELKKMGAEDAKKKKSPKLKPVKAPGKPKKKKPRTYGKRAV